MHPSDIAAKIKADIDAYCERVYNEPEPRWHLGASEIGHECSRYLWYKFRWFRHEYFSARNGRLFNRGHREEARMQEFLRETGFELRSDTPQVLHHHPESDSYFYGYTFNPGDDLVSDVTDSPQHQSLAAQRNIQKLQERISDHQGHFGGSLDDMAFNLKYELPHPVLCEFKTSGTGARKFGDLLERGVRLAKPVHWAQMCVYGFKRALNFAIYMCINKNDDDLHIEFVELDHNLGSLMVQRAGDIIWSQLPPERCSSNPAYWLCKFCVMRGPCWQQELPNKNCRSCRFAKPDKDAQWYCGKYQNIIPRDFVPKGCDSWEPLT